MAIVIQNSQVSTSNNDDVLTQENYYSREMDIRYMSVSQFKNFIDCEARTMAKLNGDYHEPPNKAMIVGNYVHTAFEDEEIFNQFVEENSDMINKKRGGKYAEFVQADKMIETLKNDEFSMFAMEGEKEQIMIADLFGCKWKMKVDSINHDRNYFADLKTTRNIFERSWSTKYDGWVSFIEKWDYVLQMAIYRKIIEQNTEFLYTPYIVAVSKEELPNKAIIHFDESRFDFEYEYVADKMERILKVKNGELEPMSCDKCEYCKSTKKLNGTIEVGELIYV